MKNGAKLVNESLNEFIGQGVEPESILSIFIDEERFEYYAEELDNDLYDGQYHGFSEIPVYEIPTEDLEDEEDQEEINIISNNRDNYPIIGKVLVGFNDEEIEILKIIDDEFHIDTLDNIEVLFPSI